MSAAEFSEPQSEAVNNDAQPLRFASLDAGPQDFAPNDNLIVASLGPDGRPGHHHRTGDRAAHVPRAVDRPVHTPGAHQHVRRPPIANPGTNQYGRRFDQQSTNYTSQQDIARQRWLQQRQAQRFQQTPYGGQQYRFQGTQDPNYQAYLRQQQMQRYGRFQGPQYANYPQYQNDYSPWQQNTDYYGNQWGHHHHRHRDRMGPGEIFGILGGLLATGIAADQINRRSRTQTSDQVSGPIDAQTPITGGRDGDRAETRPRQQETERSEPFTPKSRASREGWSEEHGALRERARNNRGQTVIFGDGNTKLLAGNENFRNSGMQEFGIRHDRTEHLLWRLRHGEANFNRENPPRNAVLMIGTNNVGRASTDDIVRGIMENHRELRTRLPNAQITVVGVLPKGDDQATNQQIQDINRKLAEQLRDRPNTSFVDARSVLTRDGTRIPEMWQPAGIHLSTQGQNRLLELINTKLRR